MCEGKQTLFELTFLALGIPVDECFTLACVYHLPLGKERRVGAPLPFEKAA